MTTNDALVEKMAKAVRKRQMERTGAGRAFDETCPPTDGELDNARAAHDIARPIIERAALEKAAKIAQKYSHPANTVIADAIRALIPRDEEEKP